MRTESERDYRAGWRLGLAGSGLASVELKVEATRRESAGGGTTERAVGLNLTTRW